VRTHYLHANMGALAHQIFAFHYYCLHGHCYDTFFHLVHVFSPHNSITYRDFVQAVFLHIQMEITSSQCTKDIIS
jgi:hypothetical protein